MTHTPPPSPAPRDFSSLLKERLSQIGVSWFGQPVTLPDFFRKLQDDVMMQSILQAKLVARNPAYAESLPSSKRMENLVNKLEQITTILEAFSNLKEQTFTQKLAVDEALLALKKRWFIIEEYKEVSSAIFNACADSVTTPDLKQSNIENAKARESVVNNFTKAMDNILSPLLEGIGSPTIFTRH